MSSYNGSNTSTFKYDQYGQTTWNHNQQQQNALHDYEHDPMSVSPTQSAMYHRNPPQHAQPYGRAQYGVSTDSTGTIQSSRMRSGSNASSLAGGNFNYGSSPQGQFSSGYQNQNQYIPTNKGHSSVLSTASNQSWSQQSHPHPHHHLSSQAGSDTNSIHNAGNPASGRSRSGSNNSTVPPARPPRPSEELNLDMFQQGSAQHPHQHPQQDYFGAYGVTQQQVEQQPTYRPTYQSRSSSLLGNAAHLQQSEQPSPRPPRHSNDIPSYRQSSQEERVSMEGSLRSNGSGRGGDQHPPHHPHHHHHPAGAAAPSDHENLPSIDQYEEMLQKIASPPLGPSAGRTHRRTEQDRQASRAARQARKQQQQQSRHHPDLILEAADEASYLDPEIRPVVRARSPNASLMTVEERKLRRRSSLPAALRTLPASNAVEELKRRSSGGISPKEIAKAMEMRYAIDDNTFGNPPGNSRVPRSQNVNAPDNHHASDQRRSWEVESVVARSDIIEGLERTSSWRQRPAPEPKTQHDTLATDIYGGTAETMGYVPPPPPSAAAMPRKNSWDGTLDNNAAVDRSSNNLDHSDLSLPPTRPPAPIVPPPPPPPSQPMPPPPAASVYAQHHYSSTTDLSRRTSTSSVASVKNYMARSEYRNSTDMKRHLLHTMALEEDAPDGSSMPQHHSANRRDSQQLYGSSVVGSRRSSRTSMRDEMPNPSTPTQQRSGTSAHVNTAINGLKSAMSPPQKSHLRNSYTLTPPSPEDEHPNKPFLAALADPDQVETTFTTEYVNEQHQQEETQSQSPMTPVSAPLKAPVMLVEDDITGFIPPPPTMPSSRAEATANASAPAGEDDDEIRQLQLQLEQLNSTSATTVRSGSGGRRSREEARGRHARHDDSHTPAISTTTTASAVGHNSTEENEPSPSTFKESSRQQPLSPSSPTIPRRPLTPTSRSTTPTPRHRPTTPNNVNNSSANNSSTIRPPPGPAPPPSSSPVMRKSALPRTTATISLPPPPQTTPPSTVPPPPSTSTSSSNTLMAPVGVAVNSSGRSRAGSTASASSAMSMDRNLMGTTPPPPLSPLPPPPPSSSAPANTTTMHARRTRKMSLGGANKDQLLTGYTSDGTACSGGGVGSFVAVDSELVALAGDLASAPLPPLPLAPLPPSAPPVSGGSSSHTGSSSSKSWRHQRERTHDRDSNGSNSSSMASTAMTAVTTTTTTTTATTTPAPSSPPSSSSLSSFTPSQSPPSTSSANSSPQQVTRLKQRVHSLEKELETAEHHMTTNLRDSADLKSQMTLLVQERDALQARVAALEEEKAKGTPPMRDDGDNGDGGDGHSTRTNQWRVDNDDDNSKNSMLRIETLELELESLQQTRTELERELTLAREDKMHLQDELAGVQQRLFEASSSSSPSTPSGDHQEEAVHLLRQQLQDLKAERDAEVAQRQELERELEKAQLRAEQEEQQYRALQESIKRQSAHASLVEKQHLRAMEELQTKHQQLLDQMVADHADALTRQSIEHEEETQLMMEKLKAELETMEQQLGVQREIQQQIQGQVQRDNLLMEKERDEARWRAKFLKAKVQDQLIAMDQLQGQVERLQEQQEGHDRELDESREAWRVREQELDHRCQAAVLEAQRHRRECTRLLRVVHGLDLTAALNRREENEADDDDEADRPLDEREVRGAYEKQKQAWQAQIRSLERRLAKAEQEATQEFESNLHRLVGLEYSPLDSTHEESG
ncbi:hypothetical protein DFQ26_004852 [Actinomortierella ambigua]|nr:hypothetical protein DFQ26_004852 [Actinomortierella ambigua]